MHQRESIRKGKYVLWFGSNWKRNWRRTRLKNCNQVSLKLGKSNLKILQERWAPEAPLQMHASPELSSYRPEHDPLARTALSSDSVERDVHIQLRIQGSSQLDSREHYRFSTLHSNKTPCSYRACISQQAEAFTSLSCSHQFILRNFDGVGLPHIYSIGACSHRTRASFILLFPHTLAPSRCCVAFPLCPRSCRDLLWERTWSACMYLLYILCRSITDMLRWCSGLGWWWDYGCHCYHHKN